MEVKEGSKWIATYAFDRKDAISFTVRGVTENGIYITGSERTPGNLVSHEVFGRLYRIDTR